MKPHTECSIPYPQQEDLLENQPVQFQREQVRILLYRGMWIKQLPE
jgi:hypothetical protein